MCQAPARHTISSRRTGVIHQSTDGVSAPHANGQRYRAAYVPASVADKHRPADLACVPVSDLSPGEVVAAWPQVSRFRAVAGYVGAAVEVAAGHAEQATTVLA